MAEPHPYLNPINIYHLFLYHYHFLDNKQDEGKKPDFVVENEYKQSGTEYVPV